MRKSFVFEWMRYFFVFLLIVGGVFSAIGALLHYFALETYLICWLDGTAFGRYDALFTQVSSTFIVVSLVSFLANNTNDILWDDTISFSLINPRILNFVSIFAYLIGNLVISVVCIVLEQVFILACSFGLSVLLLSILTYKIIGAYFAIEKTKKSLEKQFLNLTIKEQEVKVKELYEKTLKQVDEKRYSSVEDNIEFLIRYNYNETLYLIMDYIGTVDPTLFLKLCEKFDFLLDDKIRIIAEHLCISMIENKNYSTIIHGVLTELYGVEKIKITISDSVRGEIQSCYHEQFITRNFEKDVQEIVEHFQNEIQKNIEKNTNIIILLWHAYRCANIEVIDLLINYLIEYRQQLTCMINKTIGDETTDSLHNYQTAGSMYIWQELFDAKYKFLSKEQCERILQIIKSNKKLEVLLKDQIDKLEDLLGMPVNV